MADPWKEPQPWGPGTLEDYAKLSGQQECDPEEAVDIFIRRNVDTVYHGHLLDSDDNDGEYLRRIVRKLAKKAAKKGSKQKE